MCVSGPQGIRVSRGRRRRVDLRVGIFRPEGRQWLQCGIAGYLVPLQNVTMAVGVGRMSLLRLESANSTSICSSIDLVVTTSIREMFGVLCLGDEGLGPENGSNHPCTDDDGFEQVLTELGGHHGVRWRMAGFFHL